MRKLASIQKITALRPIENADKIEVATVLGWQVVVQKGQFKEGDFCVYIEIDSILPDKPDFEFMRERKFRVKTIKLRGQVSQGICFPISILLKATDKDLILREGDDMTELLGVRKYDPQIEWEKKETERLADIDRGRMSKFLKRYSWYRRLLFRFKKPSRVPFPSFIKKTDEDRIQLFPDYYEKWGELPFTVTEKLDGQSATYFVVRNPKAGILQPKWLFGVCSRNFQLLKQDNSSYWTIARKLNLQEKMTKYCDRWNLGLIIQGEIIGRKIQGNKYEIDEPEFFMFNAMTYRSGKTEVMDQTGQSFLCIVLDLNSVPVIDSTGRKLFPDMNAMVEYAKGYSRIAKIPREGVVMRNYTRNISFKIINPDFLLKFDV